jgi:hypothetical protein
MAASRISRRSEDPGLGASLVLRTLHLSSIPVISLPHEPTRCPAAHVGDISGFSARSIIHALHPRCHNSAHRDIVAPLRRDGCGGRPGRVELVTSIEGSSRPVRRIVLLG